MNEHESLRVACGRLALLLSIALTGDACGGSPVRPTPVPTLTASRFLSFGDSITEGITSPAAPSLVAAVIVPQSYPFKLQALLASRYPTQTITVVNEGRGGELAEAGTRRLPNVLATVNPEVLLLLEGINEVGGGVNRIPNAIAALKVMIGQARAADVVVMLLTYPPQRPGFRTGPNPISFRQFNDEIRTLASVEAVPVIDVEPGFGTVPGLIGIDGLHPTDAGYTRMAEIVFERIQSTFEATSAPEFGWPRSRRP